METIRVNGEEVQIGLIGCPPSDSEAVAYVARKAIGQWMEIIHEVRGRGVFAEEIIHIQENGSKVKFIFIDPATSPDVMRVAVKQLIAQAANLHYNRGQMRSRAAHPSNPEQGLAMTGPERAPKHKEPWTNVPPGLRNGY